MTINGQTRTSWDDDNVPNYEESGGYAICQSCQSSLKRVWRLGSIDISEYINDSSKPVMKQKYNTYNLSVKSFEKHSAQIKIKTIIWHYIQASMSTSMELSLPL